METLTALERDFGKAMLRRYRIEIPEQVGYTPTRTIRLIEENGGVDAVRILKHRYPLHDSDGYAKLCLVDRLDLTLESLMLEPTFRPLFTNAELSWAKEVIPDAVS